MLKKYLLPLLLALAILGCDKGIAPLPEDNNRAGFSGTITFTGTWDTSVKRTHLVVFETPLNSAADFNIVNLKYISNEIPFGALSYNYSSLDSSIFPIGAGTYQYVAVAQSVTPEVSLNREDWFVVGIYYTDGDTSTPGTLVIPEDTHVRNVNVSCDLDNLPPQPPGGE